MTVPEGVMEKILDDFDNRFVRAISISEDGSHYMVECSLLDREYFHDFLKEALQRAGKSAIENYLIEYDKWLGDNLTDEQYKILKEARYEFEETN